MKVIVYLLLCIFSHQAYAATCESKVEQSAIRGTIYESTFNKYGSGCFYAKPSEEFYGGFDFYVLLETGKKYRFPRPFGMSSWVDKIESISFKDYNADGYTDVAVIVRQMTMKDDIKNLIYYRGREDYSGYFYDEEVSSAFLIGEYESFDDIQQAIIDAKNYRQQK